MGVGVGVGVGRRTLVGVGVGTTITEPIVRSGRGEAAAVGTSTYAIGVLVTAGGGISVSAGRTVAVGRAVSSSGFPLVDEPQASAPKVTTATATTTAFILCARAKLPF